MHHASPRGQPAALGGRGQRNGIGAKPSRKRIRAVLVACSIALATAATGVLTGCGSTAESPTTAAIQVPIAASKTPHESAAFARAATGAQRFVVTLDAVCASTLRGSPSPPTSPYTSASLRRYAVAANVSLTRTYLSLRRLPAPGPARSHAHELTGAYEQLSSLVSVLARGAVPTADVASEGLLVRSRESAVNAAALRAGLPACATVNPRGWR